MVNNKEKRLKEKADLLYYKYGEYEKSLKYYQKALEINPKNVDTLTSIGSALNSLGRYDEAIQVYHKALEIDSKDIFANTDIRTCYLNKHAMLVYQKDYEKAMKCCKEVLKLYPNDKNWLELKNEVLSKIKEPC